MKKIILFSFSFIFYFIATTICLANLSVNQNIESESSIQPKKVETSLISAVSSFDDQNTTVLLGVRFLLFNDWKIFWRTPGVAGLPPEFNWSNSKNIDILKVLWPYPKQKVILGINSNVYENEVIFPIYAKIKNPQEKAQVSLTLNYVLCRIDACIPQKEELNLTLLPGKPITSTKAQGIQKFLGKIPNIDYFPSLKIHSVKLREGQKNIPELLITVSSLDKFHKPELFIESDTDLFFESPQLHRKLSDSKFQFLSRVYKDSYMDVPPDVLPLNQTVNITLVENHNALETSLPITLYESGAKALILISLVALLGGFILNFMPCVLPILFLKISDIIGHPNKTKSHVRSEFLATAVGILVSFFLLALVAIMLKVIGISFMWGSQFQQPLFIIFMINILIFFACSFFGLFEFRLPIKVNSLASNVTSKNNLVEHFFRGVFATLLATPCSAPFVGSALGFALSRNSIDIILIFLVMGIGFASLYLLIALFPRLTNLVPKPGKWMNKLQVFLGLLLIGTVIWLVYVLSMQLSLSAIVIVSCILLIIPSLLFLKNKIRIISKKIITLLILLLVILSLASPYLTSPLNQPSYTQSDALWKPFKLDEIHKLINQGKIVFVDVTATWCATCYYNKKFVLDQPKIIAILSQPNIIAMRADWTNKSTAITRYLHSFDRHAIPFNVVYSKKYPQGLILPELLTQSTVIEVLKKSAQE